MGKRLILIFCIFSMMLTLLFWRLGNLSTSPILAQTADTQTQYTLTFGDGRGMIYDFHLQPLVNTTTRQMIACLPTADTKNALLHSNKLGKNTKKMVESGLPFLTSSSAVRADMPGITVLNVPQRTANDQLARHIIGYLNTQGGVTGIEKAYNGFLKNAGDTSSISYQVDAARRPLAGAKPTVNFAAAPKKGIVLTIDAKLQRIAEKAGEKYLKKGAIVIMEPSSGKIRASVSFPQYDTQHLAAAVSDTENSPMLNRAFEAYCVGSTFKIATASTALMQGISPNFSYDCTGMISVQGQNFRCHENAGHGMLDLKHAMMVSCNPYFINLGLQLEQNRLLGMANDLSFGKPTYFAPGMGSAAGTVPTKESLLNPAALANFSFGQGTLTATPVQVAQMVSCIVNGGQTPSASLIEGTTEDGKNIIKKDVSLPVRAMREQTASEIKNFLVSCVMEEPNQKAKPIAVTAGGKTGTAQTGKRKKGGGELLEGWFVGFFPAEHPKYVVSVLCEGAQSGNQNASPVFKEIADAFYPPPAFSKANETN